MVAFTGGIVVTSLWMTAVSTTCAWVIVPPPYPSSSRSHSANKWIKSKSNPSMTGPTSTTSTTLHMFDWMNPSNKQKNDDSSKGNNDFFGNLFKPTTTPSGGTTTSSTSSTADNTSSPGTTTATKETAEKLMDETIHQAADVKNEVADPLVVVDAAMAAADVPVVPAPKHEAPVAVGHSTSAPASVTDTVDTDTDSIIHRGVVSWFSSNKGYGFITPIPPTDGETMSTDGSSKNSGGDSSSSSSPSTSVTPIFVHQSDILADKGYFRNLFRSEEVEFRIGYDSRGRSHATHVTGPGGTPPQSIAKQMAEAAAADKKRKEEE